MKATAFDICTQYPNFSASFSRVMAGLVPAIHVLLEEPEDVDARDKRGHDDREAVPNSAVARV